MSSEYTRMALIEAREELAAAWVAAWDECWRKQWAQVAARELLIVPLDFQCVVKSLEARMSSRLPYA